VLWTLTGNEIGEATTGVAEQLLQSCPLTGTMFPSLVNAVKVLAFADRADRAEPWCRYLMEEAERREAPGWRAVFCGVLAEIMLLQGRFAEAEDHAGQALDGVPSRNGSMFAVGPLASQVLAYTAMGRHDDAALRLDQPLPPALFDSVDGLGYLRARGRHYLATNCPQAALDDFLSIGLLAGRWGVDRPALIPWRTDAAEAWLQLGDRDEADRLVTEQLISGRAGNSRTRGMVLRLRAETAEPRMRPKLLTRAVEELQRAGDRYELARALADLGRAYHTLGESARGNAIRQRAWHMADESSARQLCEDIRPGSRETHQVEDPESKLSESERRVAALAAYGHTNREIAAKLYITVSTVEQHLTRVYRKLKITRRHELPLNLRLAVHGGV
jgi:DNA-binding CsgD family transcriptional regulator